MGRKQKRKGARGGKGSPCLYPPAFAFILDHKRCEEGDEGDGQVKEGGKIEGRRRKKGGQEGAKKEGRTARERERKRVDMRRRRHR